MKLYINRGNTYIIKAAFLGCFLCLGLISFSQSRFNVRDSIGLSAGIYRGVIENQLGYAIIGNGVLPTESDNLVPLYYAQYSIEGELMDTSFYYKDIGFYLVGEFPGIDFLNEEMGFTTIGATFDGNLSSGFIANFNLEGDTISVLSFYSPYIDNNPDYDFISPQDIERSTNDDNSFFIASNIATPEVTLNDSYIQRMTPEGEVLWEYIYATTADPDRCNSLLKSENGGVSALMWQSGEGTKIINLDSEGDLISIIDTELLNSISEAVVNENNEIIAASIALSEEFGTVGRICKLNMGGELVWNQLLGISGFDQRFTNIVHTLDDHYVVGGIHVEILDTPTEMDGSANQNGWLVKITDDGEVLWDRKYRFIQSPDDTHTLNDLKATCDGGYIFCGESSDGDWESNYQFSEGPPQQGWLVKVDEFGCLVEGCQLFDSIQEPTTSEDIIFTIGPNPASDFLNIYQGRQVSAIAVYELYDYQGKLLENFPASECKTTMMLDISTYAKGQYVLTLRDGDKLLQQEKIMKQ